MAGIGAAALLVAVYLRVEGDHKIRPLGREDLVRIRRYSDERYRDWYYPFE
ncbi:MAG TPA: hypothetical protein VLY04_23965 [Bryobacteraceae bacterium]|nr:hypothetical protein [Bryobacteraceae bacterium]